MIISSLLDCDHYKFTLGQWVFLNYKNIPVKYRLIIRDNNVHFQDNISQLILSEELSEVRQLRFGPLEIQVLRDTGVFKEEYLQFLKNLVLPDFHLYAGENGKLILEFSGKWSEAIYWETLALSIVNELYFEQYATPKNFTIGEERLLCKLKRFDGCGYDKVIFSDFGTRRRFSYDWHERVIDIIMSTMAKHQFLGTSNVLLSRLKHIPYIGTMAHELFMGAACICDKLEDSPRVVMSTWKELYQIKYTTLLPDTFGSQFMFDTFTEEELNDWYSFRQDSGDPFVFGDKLIEVLKKFGINPLSRTIIFSDSLNVDLIIRLYNYFRDKIKVSFGWGTNLTNDLGIKPLSMVIKLVEANGRPAVKLSDDLSKASGYWEEIIRYKKVFGYK